MIKPTPIVYKLDLPRPPAHILSELLSVANTKQTDYSQIAWLTNFHSSTDINPAFHIFTEFAKIFDSSLYQDELASIYNKFFNTEVVAGLGVMRNSNSLTQACLPPHCDSRRYTAINYIIDTGGPNVTTCMYDYNRYPAKVTESENIQYNDVTLISTYKFEPNNWYALDPQQCHSVEHIDTTRIFMPLVLKENTSFVEFVNNFNPALMSTVQPV